MNHTLVQLQILSKIKKLNREIESLRELKIIFGAIDGLTPKQQLKLTNKENKLTKLLNQL
jgi:DNA replication initiation complex subunit (GINS family)